MTTLAIDDLSTEARRSLGLDNYVRHAPMVRRAERKTPPPTVEQLAERWDRLRRQAQDGCV